MSHRHHPHVICAVCYFRLYINKEPAKLNKLIAEEEPCCFCGRLTRLGIYIDYNSNKLRCTGKDND